MIRPLLFSTNARLMKRRELLTLRGARAFQCSGSSESYVRHVRWERFQHMRNADRNRSRSDWSIRRADDDRKDIRERRIGLMLVDDDKAARSEERRVGKEC